MNQWLYPRGEATVSMKGNGQGGTSIAMVDGVAAAIKVPGTFILPGTLRWPANLIRRRLKLFRVWHDGRMAWVLCLVCGGSMGYLPNWRKGNGRPVFKWDEIHGGYRWPRHQHWRTVGMACCWLGVSAMMCPRRVLFCIRAWQKISTVHRQGTRCVLRSVSRWRSSHKTLCLCLWILLLHGR